MSHNSITQAKEIINKSNDLMKKTFEHLVHKMQYISTGRVSISLLDDVRTESYGSYSPLDQIASITVADARTIIIQPWDKTLIPSVEKSILAANLGITPANDGNKVIINVPVPTEERRKELVKTVQKDVEHARISLRNLRHEGMSVIKACNMSEDERKDVEHELDELVSNWNGKINALIHAKENDIMTI